jgi:hypothetical protein
VQSRKKKHVSNALKNVSSIVLDKILLHTKFIININMQKDSCETIYKNSTSF